MTFHSPSWAPTFNDFEVPDNIPLSEFLFDDRFRPRKCDNSPPPFIDSIDGKGYSVAEVKHRIEWLAAGLAQHLNLDDVTGNQWERVISIFTTNNVRDHRA